jgi:DNA invertase Pin-like site-specific DNA recombinase
VFLNGVRDNGPAIVGYIRTSKKYQTPVLQCRNPLAFGCEKVFEEQQRSRKENHPEPQATIKFCRGMSSWCVSSGR